VVSFCANDTSL